MSNWGFRKEGTQNAGGANTEDFLVRGYQPFAEADNVASKRNVIGTDLGWVRRVNYTDTHGNARKKEEILVAAHPGGGSDTYAGPLHLGFPDISQIYVKLNANNVVSANTTANVYVVFNQPVKVKASSNVMSITVANTAGGNNINAYLASQGAGGLAGTNANNTLVFTTPEIQGGTGSARATYKIEAQSISVSGNPVYNPEIGVQASANLTIVGAVSNNIVSGTGSIIGSFAVGPEGV